MNSFNRLISIQHRVKFGEEKYPTELLILCRNQETKLSMETETDELDWLRGRFPTEYKQVENVDDLVGIYSRHIVWKKLKNQEEVLGHSSDLLKQEGKEWFLATKVPSTYDGLKAGDQVLMVLGGSGDNLAYAIARQADKIGAELYRVPAFCLPGDKKKDVSLEALIKLWMHNREKFYRVEPRDLTIIHLREVHRARIEAMKARIGAEARLRQRLIGQVFRDEFGADFEGSIEDLFNQEKANDAVLMSLVAEEKAREKELIKTIEQVPIYQTLFKPITGVGPLTSAKIISGIVDIRRFKTASKLVKFCGVHVLEDGRFVRRRSGEVANWNNEIRQACFLLGDQMNRRQNSYWGQELLKAKARLRVIHPEVVIENGKKRYTNGHIHKMATWRTITRFVEHLHKTWWELEGGIKSDKTDEKVA